MKTTLSKSVLLPVLASIMVLLAACATSGPQPQTVSLLGAAGFRVRTPETAKQKEIFATLPAYKVESVVVKHHTYYVYKDEAKGLALVGGEAEYQRYREMARQERLAAGQHTAMMASAAESESWYGASGSDWWY
jgi:hypothetical protein